MIQAQQNMFVLFTLFKLTLDERKTLTKISTCKPLTTVPQTSAHLGRQQKSKQQVTAKSILHWDHQYRLGLGPFLEALFMVGGGLNVSF